MNNVFCGLREGLMKKSVRATAIMMFFMLVFVSRAVAADFQIQPMTMDLSSSAKSGVFSVINNGSEKIDFQVSVKEWNQDEKGKDVLTDTTDIVFFPKVMSVEANSQRAVRVGLKASPSAKEKTYRLFIQEIPAPRKASDADVKKNVKAAVTIAFRFSMPIFVKPVKPQEIYAFDSITMSKGVVKSVIRNKGNVHVKLRSVKFSGKDADGKELYSKEVAGWYILNGLTLPYEADVPKDSCGKLARMDVSAQSENGVINETMNVQKNMCAQ